MLPDCFGFPASLPTILAHSGVKGFSTQKLTWGSSADAGGPQSNEKTPEGTPFNVGVWVGLPCMRGADRIPAMYAPPTSVPAGKLPLTITDVLAMLRPTPFQAQRRPFR
jgi:hypothetical protein